MVKEIIEDWIRLPGFDVWQEQIFSSSTPHPDRLVDHPAAYLMGTSGSLSGITVAGV
jgi:hypothetical protein